MTTELHHLERITVEHTGDCRDSYWEVCEWYGDEPVADDVYDTRSEAISAARQIFNAHPTARTLAVGSARDFNATLTVIRRREGGAA